MSRLPNYPVALVATTTVSDALANWQRGAIVMSFVALFIGGAIFLSIRVVGRKLREQNVQRDAAMQNMSQRLVMFDSPTRLVVCNDRYRQLYQFPPGVAEPGRAPPDLLQYRIAKGSLKEYVRKLRTSIVARQETKHITAIADGRFIAVANRPVAGGGWVATHEDITEAKRQEASFLLLFQSNPVPMLIFDRESSRFLAVNDAAVAHYGYSRERFLIMTVPDICAGDERLAFDEIQSDTPGRTGRKRAWRHRKSDGSEIDVVIYSRTLQYEGRAAVLTAAIDVTDRIQAEAALTRLSQELIEKQFAIDQAVIVTVTDAHGIITYANDNMCKISGFSREELLGANHRIMKSNSHPAAYYRDMYQQLASGHVWRGEVCNKTKDGSLYWVDTTIVPQLDVDGRPVAYMAIRVDITERKLAEAKVSYMAQHDALTGLGNRALLNEKLDEALVHSRRRQETFAVLLLDLNGFKNINDTLGHAAGDELLKTFAERLSTVLGETDILVRLGGDEFAIVQSSAPNQCDAASVLALRILEIVAVPFNLNGYEATVGVSIGVSIAPDDGTSAGELLQRADLALYRVKADGRNNFRFFDSELGTAAISRLRLLKDLRAGLMRDEFELHYQPVFDTKTGRPCSMEALVRWRHPSEGLISPDRFIPLAEETGLMEPLGDWIIANSFADAAVWPEDIKVAVNLSAVQFRSGRLFDIISSALVESGLPPERLELEITESVLLQNTDSNRMILQQIKNIGVSIVLDDFGTGYSSLNYLTMFLFDKIKIDKSFTKGLTQRGACAAIIASVLMLARELDVIVTVEGVETLEQFELLRAAGVHQVQGYYFARPTPLAETDFCRLERRAQELLVA